MSPWTLSLSLWTICTCAPVRPTSSVWALQVSASCLYLSLSWTLLPCESSSLILIQKEQQPGGSGIKVQYLIYYDHVLSIPPLHCSLSVCVTWSLWFTSCVLTSVSVFAGEESRLRQRNICWSLSTRVVRHRTSNLTHSVSILRHVKSLTTTLV